MARVAQPQVPSQWSSAPMPATPRSHAGNAMPAMPMRQVSGSQPQPHQVAKQMAKPQHPGAQIIAGPRSGVPTPQQSRSVGQPSFSSQPSFSFYKVPPGKQPAGYPTASSFQPIGGAPLAHCASNASYASNDCQENLNLHPALNNLKKPVAFEADAFSILTNAMGDTMATNVPVAIAERKMRAANPLQKTESQLIASQAQALALQEQRRRAEAKATARAQPSPIRALLAARPSRQKIYFMRHGESESNLARRDVPDPKLTQLGLAQAKCWQETIGDVFPDLVLVSPLRRAVQTCCHAFAFEEVPMRFCRFAREIGWSCNENTIHSTPAQMESLLESLPRGDEIEGMKEALFAAPDDPVDEMASLQRLKVVLASRKENTIVVVCHFGVIAALSGCRAKNGDIYECEWGFNDELNPIMRHKTPLNEQQCVCG